MGKSQKGTGRRQQAFLTVVNAPFVQTHFQIVFLSFCLLPSAFSLLPFFPDFRPIFNHLFLAILRR